MVGLLLFTFLIMRYGTSVFLHFPSQVVAVMPTFLDYGAVDVLKCLYCFIWIALLF